MQGDRRLDYLHRYMSGGAERTIRVGELSIRMDVDCLDGSTGDDQGDTKQSQEKLPGTLTFRI